MTADLRPFALCLPLLLASASCTAAEAQTAPVRDGGKTEVRLPETNTNNWRVMPYFRVEGEKTPSVGHLTVQAPSERERFELEPHLKGEHPAGTNARWTTDFSVDFMPDATQAELVRARDTAFVDYRFDDGLSWTELQHKAQLHHGLGGTSASQTEEMGDRFDAGQRFRMVDWGFTLARDEQFGGASGSVRERRTERLSLQAKANELFRPGLSIERRDLEWIDAPANLSRGNSDGEIFSLNAVGAWGRRLSWRSSWSAEEITSPDWNPARPPAASDWDRSNLDTGLTWLPWNDSPKLDFSFSQDSGYEDKEHYHEKSLWRLQAQHRLTAAWQAEVSTGMLEESDLQDHDARKLTSGVGTNIRWGNRAQLSGSCQYTQDETASADTQIRLLFSTNIRLSNRAQLSGSYQYTQDEAARAKPTDTLIRLQFKMTW